MRASNLHIIEMGMQIFSRRMTFVAPVPFLAQGGGQVSGLQKRIAEQLSFRVDTAESTRTPPRTRYQFTLRWAFCFNDCGAAIPPNEGIDGRIGWCVIGTQ